MIIINYNVDYVIYIELFVSICNLKAKLQKLGSRNSVEEF
jgi:hypothetical protein